MKTIKNLKNNMGENIRFVMEERNRNFYVFLRKKEK